MSSLSFSTSSAAGLLRAIAVDDEREGVDRLAGDQHVELDQARLAIADLLVVHARIALRAALQLVVEVDDDLGQRQLEGEQHALRIEVLHRLEGAAAVGGQLDERADVRARGDDLDAYPGLGDGLDVAELGQLGRVVDDELASFDGGA